MIDFVIREKAGDEGIQPDRDDWIIQDLDPDTGESISFMCYRMFKMTDGSVLPDPGGFLDQEEGLMQDIMAWSWLEKTIEMQYEANQMDTRLDGGR